MRTRLRQVFVAHTPYNVLLSCGLALSQDGETESVLFVLRDCAGSEILENALSTWASSPFSEVCMLPGWHGEESLFRRTLVSRENISSLKRAMAEGEFARIHVFNDMRAEVQAAIRSVKRTSASARAVYVEDGTAAYHSSPASRVPGRLARIARKLVYGMWWEYLDVIGTSRQIDEVRAMFPALVRAELRGKNVTGLPIDHLLGTEVLEFAKSYGNAIVDPRDLTRDVACLLLPTTSRAVIDRSTYGNALVEACQAVMDKGLAAAIKYHPAEREKDPFGLGKLGVSVLPAGMPAEFIYILNRRSLEYVIGDNSTALMSARVILPSATSISLAPMLGLIFPSLQDVFTAVGIQSVGAVSELKQIMDK